MNYLNTNYINWTLRLFAIIILGLPNILFTQSLSEIHTVLSMAKHQEEEAPLSTHRVFNNEESQNMDSLETVSTILSLSEAESPEGIAIDHNGCIFISNTRGAGGSINEILRVELNGTYSVFATLPGRGEAKGLVTDKQGYIYAAFVTEDKATNGIYRIDSNGTPVHLSGSEKLGYPNALTFDNNGTLYVTDSHKGKNFEGSVWFYNNVGQVFKPFIKDQLLDGGVPQNGPDIPLPGANGIAFFPPDKLYVANTKDGSISCIRIGDFGKEPTIELIKKDYLLTFIDGIVVDENENIYGVIPASTLGSAGAPPLPPLVKLDTKSGLVSVVVEDSSKFDTPTSLSIANKEGGTYLFITNAALKYGQPPSAGPGVVKVQMDFLDSGNE